MAFPTELELAAELVVAGLQTAQSDDYDAEIRLLAAAKAELARLTGWRPFIAGAEAAVTVRKKGTLIELSSGILSVASIAIEDVALVEGADYELIGSVPPYRGFQLGSCPSEPIVFTGVLGFCADADFPADLREAVIDWCCAQFAIKRNDNAADMVTTRTDQNSLTKSKSQVDRWIANWERTLRRYRRNLLW